MLVIKQLMVPIDFHSIAFPSIYLHFTTDYTLYDCVCDE